MSGLNLEYFLYLIYRFFKELVSFGRDPDTYAWIGYHFGHWWWFSLLISLPFLVACLFFIMGIHRIRRIEHERVYGVPELLSQIKEDLAIKPPKRNETWEKILLLMSSDNPNDWQSAVIEADKMLETVVRTFNVPGQNIGEKLKQIERGDFNTLDEAWSAHKTRNRIAHEPNFHLSQREARVALANYEKVFREFDFI
ncbi:MAG: hypothetical protein COV08_00175 [Candidatus Vogelbacteria bacterium CG10_big_fil_rev_8_21_14_0_10_49_38]|uniref:DUF4145 domain-containing protein n=1 Tax=Candidatus Vogelbacteria bacterium CG10_big_fil_rev_8_21_14_0_10_49_38 TaxID=1975043 RepID=A0A2H0RIM2_9BACT|nr:MAG: hypothetical protein BK006_00175 [bacterium CG10_49_38]PIR46338.1 MAG: hypothetical protein COV08_00175 [Candidatus Vogelbacteria bacterium CG10_big_fil_rev_8_21_14_0_10_49_38]